LRQYETDEPKSEIGQAIYNLDPAMQALVGALLGLDGSLRDVRKLRIDIDTILNDSDLRDEFRKWSGR